jgi:hypothetical protein
VSDGDALFRCVYRAILEGGVVGALGMETAKRTSGNGHVDDSWSTLRKLLVAVRHKRPDSVVIVVLDEFDSIRLYADARSTIQRLRDVIDHRYATGLSAVLVSRRWLAALEQALPDVSNLCGVCDSMFVGPLPDMELAMMVARCAPEWSVEDRDRELLRRCTGGHPFLAEMVLSNSWEERAIASGVKMSVGALFDYYEQVRRLLREEGLFDDLLQITVGPRWDVKAMAIEYLARYRVVRGTTTGEDHMYRGFSEHFNGYLERCAREAPAWSVWSETEKALRALVEAVCYEAFGTAWIETLGRRNTSIRALVDGCRQRYESERRAFGSVPKATLLDFTYPGQLWQIIAAEWALFGRVLGHDRQYWSERFALLGRIRNPIAHNREGVPEHLIAISQGYCREILSLAQRGWSTGVGDE